MRISIRRCLSMLRNTSDGNELALPLQCLTKEHSIGYWYTVYLFVGGAGTSPVTVAVLCYA